MLLFVLLFFVVVVEATPSSESPGRAQHRPPRRRRSRLLLGVLGGVELGGGLGALGDGVLGELSGEDEADRGLDLAGADGVRLVVRHKLAGLARDALEDVLDERVHDGHALLGDAGVRVHLLEHLVDVRRVRLGPLLLLLLLGGLGLLLGLLGGGLLCGRHGDRKSVV